MELTQKVAERCQRMLPHTTVVIEKLVDAEGCILFPEDHTYEVLDNKGTVKAFINAAPQAENRKPNKRRKKGEGKKADAPQNIVAAGV